MELIKINPTNEKCFSDDFIKGFKCGAERQFEADKKARPKREWIKHERAEEVEGLLILNYECSECHSWERRASDFCPNCGARMLKGADDA